MRGKVIAGITGCSRYKDDVCFITGHDAATGKELWRTSTIARPGEPGGDTWGDLPLTFRAGSDAWITGSYDPATNLVYWGTAQAKPWARAVRGTDGAALYTNSTLALDPDTGKMKWYYQHLPGETQDMDEVFENVLDRHRRTQVAVQDGQAGHSVAARSRDRRVHSRHRSRLSEHRRRRSDHRQSDVSARHDPRRSASKSTGVRAPRDSRAGARWRSARRPNAMYLPLSLNCEKATFGPTEKVAGGGGTGPVRRRDYKHPVSDGNLGEFQALDIRSGKTLWRHRTASPIEHRGADDRRRRGVRRRLGPSRVRVRRRQRKDPVADAPADIRAGLSDHAIWRRANSTWPCRRASAAEAGRRCSRRNWRRRSVGRTPATRCWSSRCLAARRSVRDPRSRQ